MKSKKRNLFLDYLLIFVIGFILLYPIIWMFFSTFKTNEEIFGSFKLLPNSFSFQYYIEGWKGSGKFTYAKFFANSHDITDSIVGDFCGLWLCKI